MTVLDIVAIAWTLLALALFPIQFRVTAPYGRHARTDWGPSIPNRLGWCLMEVVSLVVFVGLFLAGPGAKTAPMWVFFALWTAHYFNRQDAATRAVLASLDAMRGVPVVLKDAEINASLKAARTARGKGR